MDNETSLREIRMGNTILRSMPRSTATDIIIYMSDAAIGSESQISTSSQTYTAVECETIKVDVYVQKKNSNGYWTTVKTFSFTEENTDYVGVYPAYHDVESGSTYRTKAYRYATVDGTTYYDYNCSSETTIK
ncbi:hypothetical protein HZI73_23080 [Vallitalea pronyensis]|uniref:Uncharacterized protein n=1 Tax=Vallitalea pronyensis TaxID=1348613 RepID=A0A8J8MPI6_9FIRM|nr:hypothetical protein [Vallitalea pronyensis]QUI24998.1 hypothetical protein HZI73_23080 [Vallitalea pronyensis]